MANSYSQLYIHIVFAVKYRKRLIEDGEKRIELQKYITGIITNKKQKLYAIYAMPDHVHILVSIKPDIAISDLVRDIKANSSKFINEQNWFPKEFRWQPGFGAFSHAQSTLDRVINYIKNQKIHHEKTTFKQEYISLLEQFEIEYKDAYLFDWGEADGD